MAVVLAQRVEQDGAEQGVAIAATFAGADVDDQALGVEVARAQRAGCAHAQTRSVGAEQQPAVLERTDGGEPRGDLARAGNVEPGAGHLRLREALDHLGAVERDGVEELKAGTVELEVARALREGAHAGKAGLADILRTQFGRRARGIRRPLSCAAQVLRASGFGDAFEQQIALHTVT